MRWKSANVPSAPLLRFVDVAFENLPENLRERITNFISNLQLESRSNVENQFKAFVELCRGSETPQMLIVKGEWGEGKTTLLNVYIDKLKKEYTSEIVTYHTKMDRILDIFERKLRENIRLSVHNLFLAAIIEDVINNLRIEGSPLPSDLQKISEIKREEQIFKAIKLLADNRKHIMFFIDEFEAIIGRKDIVINQVELVQAIIRAIRAIRGGELKRLIANTNIAPHFVFAMTPYAYSEYMHRLGIEFKGWEQRRRHLIELEPLTRKDVEAVITGLIKEVYFSKDVDIEDLFEDRRYLDILFAVSQGNLGSLINAFNLLLAVAKRKHLEIFKRLGIVRINTELIIEVFTQNKIYTYGGETEGIDRILYSDSIEFLKKNIKDERYLEIWKKLIATSSIFFENEVDERDIEVLNRILFHRFGKEVVSKVELYPVDSNVEEVLVEILKSDNNSIDKNTLLTSIRRIMVPLEDKRYLPLPLHEKDAKRNLSETLSKILSFSVIITASPRTIERIYATLRKYSEEKGERVLRGYTISQQIRERIYPAPPIFVLDFVDPRRALQLWKTAYDSVIDNPSAVEKNVRLLLINTIPGINIKDQRLILSYQYGGQEIKLKIEVFVFIHFNEERLSSIENAIEEGRIPIIIAVGYSYNKILEDLDKVNLLKRSVIIPISNITLVQLAIIQELLQKKRRKELEFEINSKRLENKLKELLESLELEKEINNLINALRDEGYVLEDLKLVTKKGIDELIDTYFMFLIGGSEFTLEELWENHLKKISETLLYGRGVRKPVVLKRDIESIEPLREQINALKANGFISEGYNGKLKIRMSTIESRIIQLLKEYENQGKTEVPVDLIRNKFIEITKAGYDVLSDVYLKVLEWRGEIEIKNKFIRLVDEKELNKSLEKAYETFIQKKEEISNLELVRENPAIAHIAMFKEHKTRFIDVDQLGSVIQSYIEKKYTLSKAQKKLLCEYIEYINNVLLEKIKMNVEDINRKYKHINYELQDMSKSLENITEFIKELDPNFEIGLIEEYETIRALKQNLQAILGLQKQKILERMKKEHRETKKIKKLKQHPMYFSGDVHNYNLYLFIDLEDKLKRIKEDFKENMKDISLLISDFISYQEKIEEKKEEIKQVGEKYDIKVDIPEFEYRYKITQTIISLRELYYKLKGFLDNMIIPYYRQLEEIIRSINNLIEKYQEIQKRITKIEKELWRIKHRSTLFEKFALKLSSLKMSQRWDFEKDTEEIREIIKELEKQLESSKSELGKIFSNKEYITSIETKLSEIEEKFFYVNKKISENVGEVIGDIKAMLDQTNSIITFLRELQKKSVVDIPDTIVLMYKDIDRSVGEISSILSSEEKVMENVALLIERLNWMLDRRKKIEEFIIQLEKDNLQVVIFKLLLSEPEITLKELVLSLRANFSEKDIIDSLIELEKKGLITSHIFLAKR